MEYMHLYTLSMCIEGLCKCMYVYIYMDVEYPRGEAEALHTLAAWTGPTPSHNIVACLSAE